ncbi:ribosomal protein S10 [Kwoniella shivajii]|uniref:Ribosomal protein S10 n=1 Tax=Kwoniella shivajii TaxID=564305 RepID=A0ABZ1D8F7_9TREE|nr:ribosomal protein S10 [Kwoniella shivajii]
MSIPSARSALALLTRPTLSNAVASSSRYLSASSASRMASAPVSSSTTSTSDEDSGTGLPVPLSKINKFLSFPKVEPHQPPHGVHVATLHLQSYQSYNLDLTTQFAVHSAHSLKIPTSLPAFLPKEKSLYTVLKSPFVKKKAQENFERITYKRAVKVFDTNKEMIDLWLRYLRQNGLPGVGMKAYIHEFVELGFGQKEEEINSNINNNKDQVVDEKRIHDAAQQLVKALSEEEGAATGAGEGEVKAVGGGNAGADVEAAVKAEEKQ